jgi:hypothetical protein
LVKNAKNTEPRGLPFRASLRDPRDLAAQGQPKGETTMARKPNPKLIDDGAPGLRGGGFPRSRRGTPARHRRGRGGPLKSRLTDQGACDLSPGEFPHCPTQNAFVSFAPASPLSRAAPLRARLWSTSTATACRPRRRSAQIGRGHFTVSSPSSDTLARHPRMAANQDTPQTRPGLTTSPRFSTSSIHFRHVISGLLALVSLSHT